MSRIRRGNMGGRLRAQEAVKQGKFRGRCVDRGNLRVINSRTGVDLNVSGNKIDAHGLAQMVGAVGIGGGSSGYEVMGWLNDEEIGDITDLIYYIHN